MDCSARSCLGSLARKTEGGDQPRRPEGGQWPTGNILLNPFDRAVVFARLAVVIRAAMGYAPATGAGLGQSEAVDTGRTERRLRHGGAGRFWCFIMGEFVARPQKGSGQRSCKGGNESEISDRSFRATFRGAERATRSPSGYWAFAKRDRATAGLLVS